MATTRNNDVVRPTLIDRCFLLIPLLPFAGLTLVVTSVLTQYQLTHLGTWTAAVVLGTTAAFLVCTAWRTWNCQFSISLDSAQNRARFRTTVIPYATIRSCHPTQLPPRKRNSPIVLCLVADGQAEPLAVLATFRFRRADREAVVRTMTELGIRVEGTSEYLDQRWPPIASTQRS
jgi:hypothetical protein